MSTEQLTQALSFAGAQVDPASQAVGLTQTGGVDMQKFRRALFIVQVGSVGAAGTVAAKLQESADNSTWSDISGGGLTTITTTNQIATAELRAGQLSAGKRYARLSITVAGNAVLLSAVALGGEAAHKPGGNDVSAVTQRFVL